VQFIYIKRGIYLSRLHQPPFLPVFAAQWTHSTWPNTISLEMHFSIACGSRPRNFMSFRSFNYPPPFPSPECISLLHLMIHNSHPSHPTDFFTRITFGEEKIMKILSVQFTSTFFYFLLCSTKYHFQLRLFWHPHLIFFPSYKKSIFKSVYESRKIIIPALICMIVGCFWPNKYKKIFYKNISKY